jgi:uncharacterized protein (TIGR03118 family)
MKSRIALGALACAVLPSAVWAGPLNGYQQTNLVSNIPGMAAVTDSRLVNPWGIAESGTSPFWISDNGAGLETLYNSAGTAQATVVTIQPPPPPPPATGNPTGVVFTNNATFNNSTYTFMFATESGSIQGWRSALGANAEVVSTSPTAVYKGLATGVTGGNAYLYATDFHNGAITVVPSTGAPALGGNFTDPNLPAGYAPFGIQNISNQLFVTYALQDATGHDDVAGAGNGFVDIFDLNGNFVKRLISQGVLNSPWGLAMAPASFGAAGGDLLVGNFGDGTINAFNPSTGALVGTLASLGNPLVNDGLWGLTFGNGGNGGLTTSLYVTAGLNDEADGLFARIDAVPEPSTSVMMLGTLGLIGVAGLLRRRAARSSPHVESAKW